MAETETEEIFTPHGLTPEEKEHYKRLAIKFGIFTGIIILMFDILVFFSYIGHSSWEKGLKNQLVQTISENSLPYTVDSFLPIQSSFAVSSAAFLLKDSEDSYATALILRVVTLYGPQAAVFVCKDEEVQFVSFLTLNEKSQNAVRKASEKSQIAYWKSRIPRILKTLDYSALQADETQTESQNEEE